MLPISRPEFRAVLAACCAILVGIGLSRFAYSPLVPAMIDANWFSPQAAAYLGAANLAGYLAGAILGRVITRRFRLTTILRGAMLLSALSFITCAMPASFWWFFPWRVLSGITGGVLMVLAAPAVLPCLPQRLRGRAAGVIFAGVGIGIVLSGTLVPLLLEINLSVVWVTLAVISLVLTLMTWNCWPAENPTTAAKPENRAAAIKQANLSVPLAAYIVTIAYALIAVSFVPHMVLLSDVIARNLGLGITAAANSWILFGIGAMIGPVLAGWLADRLTFGPALLIFIACEIPAIAAPALITSPLALNISGLLVGAAVPGVVPLVLGRVHEIIEDQATRHKIWSLATVTFAAGQAIAGYGFSWLYTQPDTGFGILFEVAAASLFCALLFLIWPVRKIRQPV